MSESRGGGGRTQGGDARKGRERGRPERNREMSKGKLERNRDQGREWKQGG